jgi:hypothetical protein
MPLPSLDTLLRARDRLARMTDKLTLDPKTSSLLVMDVQTAIVEMIAIDKDALLGRTAKLIELPGRSG